MGQSDSGTQGRGTVCTPSHLGSRASWPGPSWGSTLQLWHFLWTGLLVVEVQDCLSGIFNPSLWPLPFHPQSRRLIVSFHDEVVMVGGRGRTLCLANFSGEVTAEVAVSSSVVYSIAYMERPSIL